ncbi:hypothetical protein EYR40_002096 [Pleurotus pulmonarius]|nr:hypothetical protein EYR36_011503 [Pleurotus pulmonarius]KAF4585259.1 hypothetical protein EYR40_002096 [Pleurotus pulmonarius]
MEKYIQDRIFGKFDEATQEKVRPHFLTILDDVEVSFEQNGVESKDVTPIAPGLSFAILDSVSKDRISQGSRPVYDIADLVTLAKCMDGAIVGLNCLCQAGFVHRGISGGNILWHPSERSEDTTAEVKAAGIGKIADLEYCRYDHILSS